jgi:DNA-binding CsgD family transcriptional regulator
VAKPLTPKQAEAMELLALGKTRVEMAMILKVSGSCVAHRVDGAKKKLGATNKTLAVARYVEWKLKEQI